MTGQDGEDDGEIDGEQDPTGGPPSQVTLSGNRLGEGVEDRYSDIFFAAVETTRMPMTVSDPRRPDNPIVFCNRAFTQMTGYSMDEVVGANCRFLQGPETDAATVGVLRDAIRERREIAVEILNYRKNGSAFWNALFVSPVYDARGELVYFFGSQLDVSRRRDAEEALRQAQKMEALGQLTGGIAHDFNNLLQVVTGYSDILETGLAAIPDTPPRLGRAVHQIRAAADRAATLTQQLLAFARKQRLEGRVTNLNDLVERLFEIAQRTLGDQVEVARDTAPDLWNARLDAVQAEVAMLNVLINARDAMPDGGVVTLRTENLVVTRGDGHGLGVMKPGRYAAMTISDTGVGMPPEVLARVMDPFFTTKEEGKGTGLGLSMVYGFMQQSGGALRIRSEPGRGTAVRLLFPAVADETEAAEARPGEARRPDARTRGHETVLVVDDRVEVAELCCSILGDFGYRTLVAADGREALEVLDGAPRVDLLLTDLVMPGGMNGVALAREARRRRPRLKVLLTTGYAETSLERRDAGGGEFDVIDKPYRRTELMRKVRQVLDDPMGVG